MGLAASQARLLSITARLSDNELQSQQISNAKVRLSDKTQEASQEYINALSATKLMYTTYDSQGNSTQTELTPALMYQYSDIKNQYGISNASGQLLVSSTDAANFEASANVNEFVQAYGVALTTNSQFVSDIEAIFGSDYSEFYDADTGKLLVNFGGVDVYSLLDTVGSNMNQDDYTYLVSQISLISISGNESGTYGSLISELTNVPSWPGDEPATMPNFSALEESYNASQCNGAVGTSTSGIGHMEHNLAALIWSTGGFGTETGTITNSDGTITITNIEAACNTSSGFSLSNFSFGDTNNTGKNLIDALREAEDYECVQEFIQALIDLYCDVINYMSVNNTGSNTTDLDSTAFTMTSTASVKSGEELKAAWDALYAQLDGLATAGEAEYAQKYKEWENSWYDLVNWAANCQKLYKEYIEDIANLPSSKIPDEEDPKASWYINLWHRMNGESDSKSTEGLNGKYYKQLDDSLLSSSTWLQFALEHGIVTLEKVQYVTEAESDTGLDTTQWTATIYSSCVDISEVEDEVAIAKAEAEYNKKLKEIEAKDKKYDNDIKKLDTEHTAMQTEYESIQSVIQKNTERSFKAFS